MHFLRDVTINCIDQPKMPVIGLFSIVKSSSAFTIFQIDYKRMDQLQRAENHQTCRRLLGLGNGT